MPSVLWLIDLSLCAAPVDNLIVHISCTRDVPAQELSRCYFRFLDVVALSSFAHNLHWLPMIAVPWADSLLRRPVQSDCGLANCLASLGELNGN